MELLVDCIRNPAFLDWEVSEQLEKVKAVISEYAKNPQHFLLEAVHSAGYSEPYANSLMATETTVNRLQHVLEEFVADNYTASRIVLAASGVEHEELLKVAEPLLSDLPKVAWSEEPKPLKLIGECEVGLKSYAGSALEIAVKEFLDLQNLEEVKHLTLTFYVELDRAKQLTKSAILMNLESRETSGAFLESYRSSLTKDIASTVEKLISPLSFPNEVSRKFHSK
ncbi:mitochondrial-processing peptidase subunit alpha-like [Nicotiana tabacum]|uniref:Mitochondrial-processing peptidase subunit alpha-like n=1 Tax=Nicotiana tabacum TaxID=4097 RepID=A0AC58RQ45_TOBAC